MVKSMLITILAILLGTGYSQLIPVSGSQNLSLLTTTHHPFTNLDKRYISIYDQYTQQKRENLTINDLIKRDNPNRLNVEVHIAVFIAEPTACSLLQTATTELQAATTAISTLNATSNTFTEINAVGTTSLNASPTTAQWPMTFWNASSSFQGIGATNSSGSATSLATAISAAPLDNSTSSGNNLAIERSFLRYLGGLWVSLLIVI
jgi:hypothetical protein